MPLRRLTLLVVFAAVVASAAGCIVVPVPYHARGPRHAPPPPAPVYAPPPCGWVWVYNHWECR
jgi:hypothetical protein